jgi:hypothetical protein
MNVPPRAFIRAALALVLLAVVSHTRADPDLWGHVRFGGDIVSDGRLPVADSYSFTADRAWINHEWLSECAIYLAFAAGGAPGLAVLKILVILSALATVWVALRRQQIEARALDLLIALTVVGTFPQANHVRPQIFSLLAFALLMSILIGRGAALPRLFALPLLFAAWVNLHGGWIVGGGVLALWAVLTLPGRAPRAEKAGLFVTGAMSVAGTMANPYGWGMWQFLGDTVGFGRAEITDWQPLYQLGPGFVALWIVVMVAAAVGAARAWKSGEWELRRLIVVGALGLASFQVSRLLSFFAIATVLLLGRDIGLALQAWRRPAGVRPHDTDRLMGSDPVVQEPGRLVVIIAMTVAAALMIAGGAVAARSLACVRIGAEQPEPGVVGLVQKNQLSGRLAIWFDWGEYAIWYFAPNLKVSIDGRRETVYSNDVLQKHLSFYYVPSTMNQFLSEVRPDHIWLPPHLPVVPALKAAGWVPVITGPQSVWLTRRGETQPERAEQWFLPQSDIGPGCFPGP